MSSAGLPRPQPVVVTPLSGIPSVQAGDDLAALLMAALAQAGLALATGDVLVVSSKIASKALALTADATDREAVVAAETVCIVAERVSVAGQLTRVVRSAAGPVLAAAGVDASNTGAGGGLLVLPHDPDAVCRALHERLAARAGVRHFAILLSDTAGRPWRIGQTDFALGCHGMRPLDDLRGSLDADGRPLAVTARAVADEVAAAADLVKGKATGIPAAHVRGLGAYVDGASDAGAGSLVRSGSGDWFALGSQEAVRAALGVPPGSATARQAGIRGVEDEAAAVRVARAVAVALAIGLDEGVLPGARGAVEVARTETGPDAGCLDVTGPDPMAVGFATARLLAALAGEDVPHAVRHRTADRIRLRPLPAG